MITLTIKLDRHWVEEQNAQGVRAVRKIEKRISAENGCKLLTSRPYEIVVELDDGSRPEFVSAIEGFLKSDLGVKNPSKVVSYTVDGKKAAERPAAEPDPEPPPELNSSGLPETDADNLRETSAEKPAAGTSPVDVEKTVAELLRRVPLKYSPELAGYFRETAAVVPALGRLDSLESFWRTCPLVSIDSGYGLTDFLDSLAQLYLALGLIRKVDERTVCELTIGPGDAHSETLDWEFAVETARDIRRNNRRNGVTRPILCLKIGYWQGKLGRPEVKAYLRQLNALSDNFTMVFVVPFVEARTFNETTEALADIFDIKPIVVAPAQLGQLVDFAGNELAKRSFRLDPDANGRLEQWALSEKRDGSFFGYKTMEKLVNKLIYGKALANCRNGTDDRTITGADIAGFDMCPDPDGDPMDELAALVGLAEVKRKIEEIVSQIKAQRKLSGRGRRVKRPAIHMLFSGNPGTGKTTVARIVARILKQQGVLSKGHLVEVHGRDLCGEYIGQTAPRTSSICRDAYGSVLFIDEAYSLFRSDVGGKDYGREALDTLVAEMENHRDDLCVILAGYSEEMNDMLTANDGMRSRIPFTVEFPDYSREELTEIFFKMASGNFDYDKAFEKSVRDYFKSLPDSVFGKRGFSNGRFVRNLYERIWGKAAYRSRLMDGDIRLLPSDLEGATEEREFKQLIEKNTTRRPIGFSAWAK